MRVRRRVLEMSDDELTAVVAVIKRGDSKIITKEQKQEAIVKWLFGNQLSMNHEFTLEFEGDDLYVLLGGQCQCCPKPVNTVTYDRSKENVQIQVPRPERLQGIPTKPARKIQTQQPPIRKPHSEGTMANTERKGQKIQPIRTQPGAEKPRKDRDKQEKQPEEKDVNCCRAFVREYGLCCVGLWSSC